MRGRLQLGNKFRQVIGSQKFQEAAAGAARGAAGTLIPTDPSTEIQFAPSSAQVVSSSKMKIEKEYILAAAVIIAALIGARKK